MTMEGFKRKLTAILGADVKGYSRLMREDEEGTIRTLRAYREVVANLIKQHDGRVVDSPGGCREMLLQRAGRLELVPCQLAIE